MSNSDGDMSPGWGLWESPKAEPKVGGPLPLHVFISERNALTSQLIYVNKQINLTK